MSTTPDTWFAGRQAVLATMHGKETAIAPVFAELLGIECIVPEALDTDRLGTFTGEIERPGTVDQVLRAKAELGMDVSGVDLGIASEGSYGPHPEIPFLALGVERMMLVDRRSGLVATETEIDRTPRFLNLEWREATLPEAFLAQCGFPDHGLIVRPLGDVGVRKSPRKGIRDMGALVDAIAWAIDASTTGACRLESDMRAHQNPTRMATIERLARRFAHRLLTPCPHCAAPGWGKVAVKTGLPCAWCGTPTQLVSQEVFGCFQCDWRQALARSDGQEAADPGQCPNCNP